MSRLRPAGILLLTILSGALAAPQSSTSPKPKSKTPQISIPDPGSITNGAYRNSFFGFDYKLPFGWVDRTAEMRQDSSDPQKSLVLLAAFERPPEASGDSINSAIVVAVEATSTYAGLRSAEQYFGPLTELIKSKGFAVVNQPYEFRVRATPLIRGDFSKPRGSLTIDQSTLVVIEKGYVVSFTFIGGSQEEVEELIEKLSFRTKEASAAHQ